ncbi:MAG: transposase [Patescibacteria group bacterium]|nr:transposase [Patescibacteria group bacterium]
MPSKNALKIYKEDSYYHIYNRGVAKANIFKDKKDYKVFLDYLKIYLSPVDLQGESLKVSPSRELKNYSDEIILVAYCLMPNHFHLLIHQKNKDSINYFMRSLATKYSRYFNTRYDRVGPLFQGVYKAVKVDNEDQLVYLTKYIHRNPINILPTRRVLVGYKYSSYGNYLGLFKQVWVKPNMILGLFSASNKLFSYKSFVEELEEDYSSINKIVLD